MDIIITSTITCPECSYSRDETMPTNACVHTYECTNCGKFLTPLPGDCCVFCSYGTNKCPSQQTN